MENVLVVLDGFDPQSQAAQPQFLWAAGCDGVRRAVRKSKIRMVATRPSLPDGNWYTILRELVNTGSAARLIVCSPRPDESLQRQTAACGVDFAVCELSEQGVAARRETPASAQAA